MCCAVRARFVLGLQFNLLQTCSGVTCALGVHCVGLRIVRNLLLARHRRGNRSLDLNRNYHDLRVTITTHNTRCQ